MGKRDGKRSSVNRKAGEFDIRCSDNSGKAFLYCIILVKHRLLSLSAAGDF